MTIARLTFVLMAMLLLPTIGMAQCTTFRIDSVQYFTQFDTSGSDPFLLPQSVVMGPKSVFPEAWELTLDYTAERTKCPNLNLMPGLDGCGDLVGYMDDNSPSCMMYYYLTCNDGMIGCFAVDYACGSVQNEDPVLFVFYMVEAEEGIRNGYWTWAHYRECDQRVGAK